MRNKTPQEQTAAAKQTELLVNALQGAAGSKGYWLNPKGRMMPRLYPNELSASAFNTLIMGLHTDQNNYNVARYTFFQSAKSSGEAVMEKEKGIPFNRYKWDKYVNRHDPDDTLSRDEYKILSPDQQALYKGVRQREIRTIFNVDQTLLPEVGPEKYRKMVERYGSSDDRGYQKDNQKQLHSAVNKFAEQMKENLVPIRKTGETTAHYDTAKDAVYMPERKWFLQYGDYVNELVRQVVGATGHRQRLAREGMVMQDGRATSEDAVKYEQLVTELATGVKMMEFGLPGRLSEKSQALIDDWIRELKENPCLIDAVESDVNNALDVIRKAEQGEKIEYATMRNRQQTAELREGQHDQQVDSREALIMQDILRHGGMVIDDRNFTSTEEKDAFLEKFDLAYYETRKNQALNNVHDEDPEFVEYSYTQAFYFGADIERVCQEYLPKEWNLKGSFTITGGLKDFPDRKSKEMVIVRDEKTGIADVVLPAGAMSGGYVALPEGDKRPFKTTPDEVMSAEERKERQARVVTNNLPGFSKQRIDAALRQDGATYVRFFNNGGLLAYRPDDRYFEGKRVSLATLEGNSLREITRFNVEDAVRMATDVQFDRIQMLRDDNNRWALYLKPMNEPSFSIYPDKEDINRFFSTVRQEQHEAAQAVRMELAQKYYALGTHDPKLKIDLFGEKPEDVDLSNIQRVNIFRAKDGKTLCVPTIKGVDKLQPREVTPQQWQRMWIAEDVAAYKTHLAARLFADVLKQQQSREQEDARNEGKHENQNREQTESVSPSMLKQWDTLKQKHPDAVILFRNQGNYEAYRGDAGTVSKILGIQLSGLIHPTDNNPVEMASFRYTDLDSYLPKLIRAGQRVAICDMPEAVKMGNQVDSHPGVETGNAIEGKRELENEVRCGRRM